MPLLYQPSPSKCVVPIGLEPTMIPAASAATLVGKTLAEGLVVGFVCLTPDLLIRSLGVGGKLIQFSVDGFPSESASGDGILLPVMPFVNSMHLTATMHNRMGMGVYPTAFFLVEIDRQEGKPTD